MQKKKKQQLLKLIDRSRPRPVIRQRSTVFEDKKKYKRSRQRAKDRQEMRWED